MRDLVKAPLLAVIILPFPIVRHYVDVITSHTRGNHEKAHQRWQKQHSQIQGGQ